MNDPSSPSLRQPPVDSFGKRWRRRWRATIPVLLVCLMLAGAYALQSITGGIEAWALSGQGLRDWRLQTLVTHIIAHAGWLHLALNALAMLQIGVPLMLRLGDRSHATRTLTLLFIGSGLAGGILFVALNWTSRVALVGASGAIFGIWAGWARLFPDGNLIPLRSRQVHETVWRFIIANLLLFGILFALNRMEALHVGLAWEAHLGGFLFGLLATPYLIGSRANAASD